MDAMSLHALFCTALNAVLAVNWAIEWVSICSCGTAAGKGMRGFAIVRCFCVAHIWTWEGVGAAAVGGRLPWHVAAGRVRLWVCRGMNFFF
jgi:hypothetical protein